MQFIKKTYNPQKKHRQAGIGFSIMCIGFVLQFILEKFLWAAPMPGMAVYIIGVPFCTGGLIFGHALLTILGGEPHRSLHLKNKDERATYQANMIKLRSYLKISILSLMAGFVGAVLFLSNQGPRQLFFVGIPLVFVGAIMLIHAYNRYARCPACNHLPSNKTRNAVAINLQRCPNCGAKLG